MHFLIQIDWDAMFVPTINLGEIFIRGTVVYLFLFTVLRILRREAGTIGVSDLLVIVLIADAIQNAMSADYHSVTEGFVLVCTIVVWDFFLDWLGYRFPKIQRLLHPPPLPLIRNGQMIRKNMRHELISIDELMSQLREQGIEDIEEVKKCFIEGNGRISVIKYKNDTDNNINRKQNTFS